jgi:hypothetical protein
VVCVASCVVIIVTLAQPLLAFPYRGELVKRVTELCRDERRRLERQAREEAAEEAAAAGLPPPLFPRASADNIEGGAGDDGEGAAATKAAPVPTGPPASVERDGLCVVCQENEAQVRAYN